MQLLYPSLLPAGPCIMQLLYPSLHPAGPCIMQQYPAGSHLGQGSHSPPSLSGCYCVQSNPHPSPVPHVCMQLGLDAQNYISPPVSALPVPSPLQLFPTGGWMVNNLSPSLNITSPLQLYPTGGWMVNNLSPSLNITAADGSTSWSVSLCVGERQTCLRGSVAIVAR